MPDRNVVDLLNSHPAAQLLADIGRYADQAGYRAAVAGGFVRDLLLGTQNHDIDIVIEGDAPSFAQILVSEMYGEIISSSLFSTVAIKVNGIKVDLVTARRERYPYPGSLPEVTPGTFAEDIRRRDFTINALLIEIVPANWGNLLDSVGGKQDLTTGTIRILHEDSFRDDPTRLFRAVRYSQRLGFTMDGVTSHLFRRALESNFCRMVSVDRLAKELRLVFNEKDWIRCYVALEDSEILQRLLDTRPSDDGIQQLRSVDETMAYFKYHGLRPDRLAVIALILGIAEKPFMRKVIGNPNGLQKALRFREQLPAVIKFLAIPDSLPHEIYATLVEIPATTLAYLWIICQNGKEQVKIRRYMERSRYIHTALNGSDIAKLVGRGPQVKTLLTKLLYAKLDGRFSSRQDEVDYINNLISSRAID
jgi:tRNA nucleotidyltransferase (CCA-adding enzyme)